VTHHLLGAGEIAQLLGLSRQRVDQLARDEDFPLPEVELISAVSGNAPPLRTGSDDIRIDDRAAEREDDGEVFRTCVGARSATLRTWHTDS
jgi:hypothetical protein